MSRIQAYYDRIPDWIWPHLTGDQEPCPKEQEYFSVKDGDFLDDANRVLSLRQSQVEIRDRTVESKLMSLLILTSALSVAVTASLAATTTLDMVKDNIKVFAWIAVVLVFYVVVQLLRSLWCTVAGLMRRSYKQMSPQDLIPRDDETRVIYCLRLLNLQLNYICSNEWVVNQKVSEMAVAHVALRNALIATFVLIVLALVIASTHLT